MSYLYSLKGCMFDSETLQYYTMMQCTKNLIYAFPEMNLHGLVPNSYIYVSAQQKRKTDPGNTQIAHRYMIT
jgi:hypothetical protein